MLLSILLVVWYLTSAFAAAVLLAANYEPIGLAMVWPLLLIKWIFRWI